MFPSLSNMRSDILVIPLTLTLTRYIKDIMLIGQSKQELASTLANLVRYIHSRGWEVSPRKIQEPMSFVKFLRS